MKKKHNWTDYYKKNFDSPTTPTLLKALEYYKNKKISLVKDSIDIGCGAGQDVAELLNQGWNVLAVDKENEVKTIVKNRFKCFYGKELEIKIEDMENIFIPKISLVNASFSLPFCHPDYFLKLWDKITNQLFEGGIFCGQLFGIEDSWVTEQSMTFHERSSLDSLFKNFTIHYLNEENSISKASSGEEKNWHVFNIVAIKRK